MFGLNQGIGGSKAKLTAAAGNYSRAGAALQT